MSNASRISHRKGIYTVPGRSSSSHTPRFHFGPRLAMRILPWLFFGASVVIGQKQIIDIVATLWSPLSIPLPYLTHTARRVYPGTRKHVCALQGTYESQGYRGPSLVSEIEKIDGSPHRGPTLTISDFGVTLRCVRSFIYSDETSIMKYKDRTVRSGIWYLNWPLVL